MGALASQLQARRERLQRFAEAATRYQIQKNPPPAPIVVADVLPPPSRREYETRNHPSIFTPTSRRVLKAVSAEFDMPIPAILGHSHDAKYRLPRYVVIGLILDMTRMSLPALGRQLGNRDHTTILHGRRRIHAILAESEAFRNRYDQIKQEIMR